MAEGHPEAQGSMDLSLQPSEKARRSIKPTWKVRDNLEGLKHELSCELSKWWQKIQTKISAMCLPAYHVSPLEGALRQLCSMHGHYKMKAEDYESILRKLHTDDSLAELQSFQHLNSERDSLVHETKLRTEARIAQLQEMASHVSESTKRSKRTSKSRSSKSSTTLSEQLIKARAEAEATKIQAAFAQQKAEMEAKAAQQKAEMEANAAQKKAELEALEKQYEHAAAMARLSILEQAISGSERDSTSLCDVEAEDPLKRTRDYVLSQSSESLFATNVPVRDDISPEQQGTASSAAHRIQGHYYALPVQHPVSSSFMDSQSLAPQQMQYSDTQVNTNVPPYHQNANSPVSHPYVAKPMDFKLAPRLNAYAAPLLPTSVNQNPTNNVITATQPATQYLDTARGVNPIVSKLPYNNQERWTTVGSRYKNENRVSFPPFSYFCEFIKNIAESKNDPSFSYGDPSVPGSPPIKYDSSHSNYRNRRGPVSVKKTDILATPTSAPEESSCNNNQDERIENPNRLCPIHKKPHPLKKCIGFRRKPIQERRELLKKLGICFKCCASTEHVARDCKIAIKCIECGSEDHVQALHPSQPSATPPRGSPSPTKHGGENTDQAANTTTVSSSCTEVCGEDLCDKSCARICLVNIYPKGQPERALRVYAILDDQSNHSLARSELFDLFNIKGDTYPYTLGTCSGISEVSGRRASGLVIASLKGNLEMPLPTLVECNQIPSNREEIPTPEAAFQHPHLRAIASEIPSLDKNADILVLLGRDILRLHKIRQQINGPHDAPFAQRLDLGWVIIGNVCIGRMKRPTNISSFKTHMLPNGRSTCFQPCPYHYQVKEKISSSKWLHNHQDNVNTFLPGDNTLGLTVFNTTSDDNKLAPAIADKEFLKLMDKEFIQDDSNSWVAPLPFRSPRSKLPNNLKQAVSRFSSLKRTLKRKPEMEKHFVGFMQKVFERDHAEPAPPLKEGEECWYLPSFGMYHPRKPDQIRVVFDSSAQYEGVSLNNLLLTGPNLNNSLIGVLIRFRQEPVAVMADIQQMFHCFIVKDDDRNYLRFLWHKDNDVNNEVIDYRMKVHVFGNSPSPAVAIYGLRRTAHEGEKEYGSDARQFVERNFYVDDGLKSLPASEEVIDLLSRTQEMLSVANLRLHKIISNNMEVMKAFPSDDHAINLKDLDLSSDTPPMQRSLGLLWNTEQDTFTFQVSSCDKPFTKRGVLSVVNSIYDPLGFIAPITIQGKLLLRQLTTENMDWDTPLPAEKQQRWEKWKTSLQVLEQLQVPRCYVPSSLSAAVRKEIHIFSDASVEAIAAVAYLRLLGANHELHCGFVLGKAKLTPKPAHSIPRLELCAAVLAVEIAEAIRDEMDIAIDSFTFYTDSRVVLGYIHNQTRQFYVYVGNRVERIRSFSAPDQWHYVSTQLNPADRGTRPAPTAHLLDHMWLSPPSFLYEDPCLTPNNAVYDLVDLESDKEIRPMTSTLYTSVIPKAKLEPHRFEHFSTWSSIVRAVARLFHIAQCFAKDRSTECHGWHMCTKHPTAADIEHAEQVIIWSVQQEVYHQEIDSISRSIDLSRNSALYKLNPVIDHHELLRVGGRIGKSDLCSKEQNPVIIPGGHYISALLIRHYHEKVKVTKGGSVRVFFRPINELVLLLPRGDVT